MTIWTYPACTVVNVHDGDTLDVDIDLGQDMWVRRRSVRLFGAAARELAAPGGVEARDYLANLLPLDTPVSVTSIGWDKYGGRIDGSVVRLSDNLPIAQAMISAGYAAPWNGQGSQPLPAWPLPARNT